MEVKPKHTSLTKTACQPHGSRKKWPMELPFHHWQAELLSTKHSPRHIIHHSPMCPLLQQSQMPTWKSSQRHFLIPMAYKSKWFNT
jgi:hypothetical protein